MGVVKEGTGRGAEMQLALRALEQTDGIIRVAFALIGIQRTKRRSPIDLFRREGQAPNVLFAVLEWMKSGRMLFSFLFGQPPARLLHPVYVTGET